MACPGTGERANRESLGDTEIIGFLFIKIILKNSTGLPRDLPSDMSEWQPGGWGET